jgi:hypothetical protein
MSFQDQGFHNCTTDEVAEMVKQGWTVCTDEHWRELIADKRFVPQAEQAATIQAQPVTRRPGRPRKEVLPSILNDGDTDDHGAKSD